jgi:diguanylate cyclase (GGDEF)-like protein
VFNRAYFLSQLKQHVRLESAGAVGYMQIDMDNLKVINDGSGHAAGDAALVHLVRIIDRLVPGAIIGRLGGDEFGIAVLGMDNKAALRRLGDHILSGLAEPVAIGGRMQRLSATIGVAVAPQDGVDVDQLISKADLALYKGKRSGRYRTVAFDSDMLADERHKRFIERELRAAVLLNELDLHYQPVFAADGRLTSHESLVRWQHPVRGLVGPAEFIPVAEQSELIDSVGDWVLRRACIDRAALGPLPIAINISAVQLRRHDFAERFAAILSETDTPGSVLVVEITETVPLSAGRTESANLQALRQMGVRIAIDDFGAGHASLEYLRKFKFDILKLDRSLVANIETNRVDMLLVGAICRIARVIGLSVVAEGVETEEQRAALIGLGCTHMQGFLLGRPAPLAKPVVARKASVAA